MSGIRVFFAATLALLNGAFALAHDPGLSSAHLVRSANRLDVQLSFAWADIAPLAGPAAESTRPNDARLAVLGPELAKVAGGIVRVSSGERALESSAPIVAAGSNSPTEVIISLRWLAVDAGALRVEFPVLANTPFGHRMMLTLDQGSEPIALLDARHSSWELPAMIGPVSAIVTKEVQTPQPHASWLSFIMLGIEHILTGFDHLCFLLALLLVAPRLRDVLTVVTTFTVAHSLTLAAAALGLVSLSSSIVEPLIAASIVYVGLENLFFRRQPRYRLALVFGFGLIHGLGFASGLAERLPGVTGFAVVPPLLGFNLGVETGQLAVAGLLVPLIALARHRPNLFLRLQPACSFLIAGAGLVWLLQRV